MTDAAVIRYEVPLPKVARITLDRADTRNAQDTRLLYELNDAFDRAAQRRRHLGHRARRRGPALLVRARPPRTRHRRGDVRVRDRRHLVRLRVRRRRGADGAREGDLHRLLGALAQHPEADDRRGAGQGHRGRAHARVAVRSRRRRLQRRVHRQHGGDGRVRRRVLQSPVGGRRAQGEGDAVHVRRSVGSRGEVARDGQPRRRPRRAAPSSRWRSPPASPRSRCSR